MELSLKINPELLAEIDNGINLLTAMKHARWPATGELTALPTFTPDEPAPVVAESLGEPEVDSDGMPWDPDIHAATRGTNADGTWKAKRGMADKAKEARDEFKASGGNVVPPDVSDAPPPVAAAPVPPVPAAAPVPPVPVAPTQSVTDPGAEVCLREIGAAFESGKITIDDLAEFYMNAGISDPMNPIPEIEASAEIRIAIVTAIGELQ